MTNAADDLAVRREPQRRRGSVGVAPTARRLEFDVPLGTVTRPTWRGRTHLGALVVAVPLLVAMWAAAPAGRARIGVAVYAVGLWSMLAASTTYHRWVHTLRWRAVWRRADHAMIYLAIAGTSTPLCLMLLPAGTAAVMLVALWAAALVGATIKLCRWQRADRVATGMYIANSWAGAVLVPVMAARGLWWASVLLAAGGVVYISGAAGFARRWPTLRPAVFSYHEVWHVCTLTGAAAHFAAVWIVAT